PTPLFALFYQVKIRHRQLRRDRRRAGRVHAAGKCRVTAFIAAAISAALSIGGQRVARPALFRTAARTPTPPVLVRGYRSSESPSLQRGGPGWRRDRWVCYLGNLIVMIITTRSAFVETRLTPLVFRLDQTFLGLPINSSCPDLFRASTTSRGASHKT